MLLFNDVDDVVRPDVPSPVIRLYRLLLVSSEEAEVSPIVGEVDENRFVVDEVLTPVRPPPLP